MADVSMLLPEVMVRGWKLAAVTAHGVRVWWHLERNEPWAAGVDASLSREAREYAMTCVIALQRGTPVPPPPVTADQVIPWDAYSGLIELDMATLDEGDPV